MSSIAEHRHTVSDNAREDSARERLDVFIEENSYLGVDWRAYEKAEHEWSRFPPDSEEGRSLELMRRKKARKEADQAAFAKFIRKIERLREKLEQRKQDALNPEFYMAFVTVEKKDPLEAFLSGEGKPPFNEVFDRFRKEKGAGRDADICRKANLRQDTLSKLRKESVNVKRDYLWALAIALGLDLSETEELFNSCGLSIHGGYRLQQAEERRERAFEFCIREKWTVAQVNEVLAERNLLILGNDALP